MNQIKNVNASVQDLTSEHIIELQDMPEGRRNLSNMVMLWCPFTINSYEVLREQPDDFLLGTTPPHFYLTGQRVN